MDGMLRYSLFGCVFAGLIALAVASVRGDTVITQDGRWLVGDVQKTDSGYVIQTNKGPVQVAASEVSRILVSVKTPPTQPVAPATVPADDLDSTDASTAPDRLQVLKLASDELASHNPMKAVKYIKTYLDAHTARPDEPMIDALAIALAQCDGIHSRLFNQAVDLFKQQTRALEATRPGEKRWGIQWMPAEKADHLMQAWQESQNAINDATSQINKCNQGIKAALNKRSSLVWGNYTQRQLAAWDRQISNQINELQQTRAKAQEQYSQALAKMVKPDFPKSIDLSASRTALASTAASKPAVAVDAGDITVPPGPWRPPTTYTPPPPPVGQQQPPSQARHHATQYGAAFVIAPGLAVAAASTVAGATRLEFQTAEGGSLKGEVVRVDKGLGLALVKFTGGRIVNLQLGDAASVGPIQCVGYPDVDLFNPKPQVMDGTAPEPSKQWEVGFDVSPRLPGAPVLQHGKVVGVALGDRDTDPAHVPAVTLEQLKSFLKDDAHPGTIASDPTAAVMQVVASK